MSSLYSRFSFFFVFFFSLSFASCVHDDGSSARVYYIDPETGDNSDKGTDKFHPWADLSPLKGRDLEPGTRILIRRGRFLKSHFTLSKSGEKDNPILLSSYGSGDKPVWMADSTGMSLTLYGAKYVVISDIVFKLPAQEESPSTSGVLLLSEGDSIVQHIKLNYLDFLSGTPTSVALRIKQKETRGPVKDIDISHCNFHLSSGMGIVLERDTLSPTLCCVGLQVKRCLFEGDYDAALSLEGIQEASIQNSLFVSHSKAKGISVYKGEGLLIEANEFTSIDLPVSLHPIIGDVKLRSNLFENFGSAAISATIPLTDTLLMRSDTLTYKHIRITANAFKRSCAPSFVLRGRSGKVDFRYNVFADLGQGQNQYPVVLQYLSEIHPMDTLAFRANSFAFSAIPMVQYETTSSRKDSIDRLPIVAKHNVYSGDPTKSNILKYDEELGEKYEDLLRSTGMDKSNLWTVLIDSLELTNGRCVHWVNANRLSELTTTKKAEKKEEK